MHGGAATPHPARAVARPGLDERQYVSDTVRPIGSLSDEGVTVMVDAESSATPARPTVLAAATAAKRAPPKEVAAAKKAAPK